MFRNFIQNSQKKIKTDLLTTAQIDSNNVNESNVIVEKKISQNISYTKQQVSTDCSYNSNTNSQNNVEIKVTDEQLMQFLENANDSKNINVINENSSTSNSCSSMLLMCIGAQNWSEKGDIKGDSLTMSRDFDRV